MNLNDYQQHALRTHNEDLGQVQAFANYALGLNGEAGEVADHIKKGIFHGHEMNRHELAKELGDCLWYISNLSHLAGFTLQQIAEMNVTKLMKRYPEGFDKERSVNRDDK
ncbi:nucleoside triphosphate pyrophosphohydrolase family protein [Neobacillus drentensis]|uniref:nucleoside triphosphate pyrophosphohydrolase family protein n=1 Tax=Neobacillus drentensis TaxID=220684 RepID=UPI001F22A086|nr:nucleoside triphosphate pyrophosphohydrolase family protein [Neobacillus drentensis]ULT55411.1 nucleoside triphosphate pyrophosphohydrolase family protein [Neobacillus drentensis]